MAGKRANNSGHYSLAGRLFSSDYLVLEGRYLAAIQAKRGCTRAKPLGDEAFVLVKREWPRIYLKRLDKPR